MSKVSPVDEEPAPEYTKTDENTPSAPLEPPQKEEDRPEHPIITPVPKHPDLPTPGPTARNTDSHADTRSTKANVDPAPEADRVTALFAHISAADTAAATHLIRDACLPSISPDTPNENGETPLLASTRARSAPTARALLALGADPNLAGRPHPAWDEDAAAAISPTGKGKGQQVGPTMTPLMLASATGQLPIVKLLVSEYGADDGLVGARGETALWLAARAGHRDVVAYLPARRGGAWRRLRHSRDAARLRGAVVTAGQVGRFLGYTVPLALVFDIPRAVGRFVWRKRWRAWGLVVRAVRGLPRFLVELVRYIGTEMPRDVWRVVEWVGRAAARAGDALWRGLVDGLRKVGGAVAYAAQRVVSALHSFVVAVVGFFKEVKLRDLGHDLLVAMEALLVKLPGTVWTLVIQSPAAFKRAVKAVFKSFWVRLFLGIAFGFVFMVPRTLWKLLESLWACLGRGVEELISLLNPKMVPSKRSRS